MTPRLSITLLLMTFISACSVPQTQTTPGSNPAPEAVDRSTTASIYTHSPEKHGPKKLPDTRSEPEDLWSVLNHDQTFSRHSSHSRIKPYLARYTNKQTHFNRLTESAAQYLPYVVAQLRQENMPTELALIPFIESSYNPFAYSYSGAAGLWQFIPSTAKHLGLKSNWWYDGRRDIVTSTEAALRYLRYLHKRFNGDWLLAMAAYNGGEGTIGKAMRKNRSKGQPVDYWALDLPQETAAYVPHFLALVKIIANPDKYGLKLSKLSTEVNIKPVALEQQIDLQQAARFANIETESFYQLNPGFLRWASPPSGPFSLLLPVNSIATFNKQIAQIPKTSWLASQRHRVQLGDTLSEIAQHYHVSMEAVVSANGLKSLAIINGQILKIPAGASQLGSTDKTNLPASSAEKLSHRVRKGDTLSAIAKKYQVSLKNLLRWNQWSVTKPLQPGQSLIVAPAG